MSDIVYIGQQGITGVPFIYQSAITGPINFGYNNSDIMSVGNNSVQFNKPLTIPATGSINIPNAPDNYVNFFYDTDASSLSYIGATGTAISNGPVDYFHSYDSTGDIDFTSTPITVGFDTVPINSTEWTLVNGNLTAQNTDKYLFLIDVGTTVSNGSNRSICEAYLEVNTGGGFTRIIGTNGPMYNREDPDGYNSTSICRPITVSSGDIFRVRVVRIAGNDTLKTLSNSSRITVVKIRGEIGPPGPTGPIGPDGDITWEEQWTPQNYSVNQAVSYLGSSYVCKVNTISNEVPTNTDFWDILAERGTDGTAGSGSTVNVYKDNSSIIGTPFEKLNFIGFDNIEQDGVDSTQVNIDLGFKYYGSSATDPVGSPSGGDKYYNTVLNQEMFYDSGRGKWLSMAIFFEGSGLNGTTASGVFYRRFNGMSLSATIGPFVPKGTIVSLSFNNATSALHTYEILVGGIPIAELSSGGAASAYSNTINSDFNQGVMSSRNKSGSSSTNNFQGSIYYRLRI